MSRKFDRREQIEKSALRTLQASMRRKPFWLPSFLWRPVQGALHQDRFQVKRRQPRKTRQFHDTQFFVVNCEPFRTDVGFAINATGPETLRWLKRKSGERFAQFDQSEVADWESNGTVEGRTIPFRGGFVVLLKVERDRFCKFVGLLTHESTHVVQYMLRDRRIPLSEDTEELHAYMVEYLVTEALRRSY